MENDAALYCPNESCRAVNPLNNKFCQQCSTPLPKRYLWAVGDGLSLGNPGEILADRYFVINQSVVLDTKPGLLPQVPELENSQSIRPYLKLIPYRLHVPQVYGVLTLIDGQFPREILLLEKPPLFVDVSQEVHRCSDLTDAWPQATSMRQLNWLWQMAHLWQPLKSEGVVSSLLDSQLLRVEGSLVRLLELRFDSSTELGLPQLGEFWQHLVSKAKPAIAEFVHQISNNLINGKIRSSEVLISVLDQGMAELGRSQTPKIQIATKTDTGPSRQRNEDACYPPGGTLVNKPPQPSALAIVCDGIGGHEGGNIASNLAINTIQQRLQEITKLPDDHIEPSLLLVDLEKAVAAANDKISQRNDSENRQGRKRMGTTLVMALPIAHEMYITHVGDSRAYWITRHGCYQVTLDDDVASREVRLGYAIYRDAVQQGGAGSLVQALGMSPSSSLHPTAQRFILDEDSVFLLTSDGLSDFDRVEDYWETEILPILNGEDNLVNVANKLVEIANTKNGHDNVTIALLHYQVKYSEPELALNTAIPNNGAIPTTSAKPIQATLLQNNPDQKTQVIPENQPGKISQLPLQWIVPLILAIAAGSLAYWAKAQGWLPRWNNPDPISVLKSPVNNNQSPERSLANLVPESVIETKQDILINQQNFPPGNFFRVIETKPNPKSTSGDSLVHLRVCSPEGVLPANAKKEGWIELSRLKDFNVLRTEDPSPCDSVSPQPDSPRLNPSGDTSATPANTR